MLVRAGKKYPPCGSRADTICSVATVVTLVMSDYFGLVSGRKENKIEKANVHFTLSQWPACHAPAYGSSYVAENYSR